MDGSVDPTLIYGQNHRRFDLMLPHSAIPKGSNPAKCFLQAIAITPAHSKRRPILQPQQAVAICERLHFRDPIQADNRRTMNSNEGGWV